MGGPGDEESNSGVFLPAGKENIDGRNLYKKQESAGQLSANYILDKVTSPQFLINNPLQAKKPSYAGSVASFRSGALSGLSISSPTELKEMKQAKKQRFWDYFSMVCSISYGIFIVVGSLAAYASDLLMSWSYKTDVGEIWNLSLCIIGILLLLFLCFDIRRYMSQVKGMHKGSNFEGIKLVEGEDGELHIEVPTQKGRKKHVPEYYGFTSGRWEN